MQIDYKSLDFIDFKLKEIISDCEKFLGTEQLITSLYRMGDTGVHGQLPVRGIDLRCRDHVIGHRIEEHMNSIWKYDPLRPYKGVCMFHDAGSGAHIHLQSHPNSIRI